MLIDSRTCVLCLVVGLWEGRLVAGGCRLLLWCRAGCTPRAVTLGHRRPPDRTGRLAAGGWCGGVRGRGEARSQAGVGWRLAARHRPRRQAGGGWRRGQIGRAGEGNQRGMGQAGRDWDGAPGTDTRQLLLGFFSPSSPSPPPLTTKNRPLYRSARFSEDGPTCQ